MMEVALLLSEFPLKEREVLAQQQLPCLPADCHLAQQGPASLTDRHLVQQGPASLAGGCRINDQASLLARISWVELRPSLPQWIVQSLFFSYPLSPSPSPSPPHLSTSILMATLLPSETFLEEQTLASGHLPCSPPPPPPPYSSLPHPLNPHQTHHSTSSIPPLQSPPSRESHLTELKGASQKSSEYKCVLRWPSLGTAHPVMMVVMLGSVACSRSSPLIHVPCFTA